jgi:serine/threonine protein kinase
MSRVADYELVDQLQAGNHGTFFTARPPARLGIEADLVALKVLDRHATDNELKRMGAELRVLLSVDHPYLVDVIDAGHERGRLYYATRFFSQGSLQPGPCPADRVAVVAGLVADAAEAAHALHQVGVAHRDIKPTNILLADGRGHLSDLGVANYSEAHFTTTGASPVGTLTYADPELINGQPAGRASDIWSLGATLHMVVTGRSVIGDIPDAHLAAAIGYVLEAEADVDPACPPGIRAVVARATQRERADRYLTAQELADDLRSVAGQSLSTVVEPSSESSPLLLAPPREASAALPPHHQPVLVIGARSPAGYFNHPDARRCRLAGRSRDPEHPWRAERGIRPPLGVLLGDDGRNHLVHCDLVVGRQPEEDEEVAEGRAVPIAYEASPTMSRVHLRIEPREWEVLVVDTSSNGTSVRPAGGGAPRPLEPGRPTPLTHGDEIVFEGRSLRYHCQVRGR